MGNFRLASIASLALVPWGLCLPTGDNNLEVRQEAPTTACASGAIDPNNPVWVAKKDPYVSVQVNVNADPLKGFFSIVVNTQTGDVMASSSHFASLNVSIMPYYDLGMQVTFNDTKTTNYNIWIDALKQPTQNFYSETDDYEFLGVTPRVDMQINRTTDYNIMSFPNVTQGAYAVSLIDVGLFNCGPSPA